MKYSNKPNKNERSTESKYMQPSVRKFKRIQSGQRSVGHPTMVMQEIPAMVRFTPNKKYRKRFLGHKSVSRPLSHRRAVNQMKDFVEQGLGKIETFAPKTIFHSAGVTV